MKHSTTLEFTVQKSGATLIVEPSIVALAAFTGRDQVSVKAHLDELSQLGVEVPKVCPVVYAVTTDRVTTASVIEVLHTETSGELEFAIILKNGQRYIGVASDHTDRRNEKLSIGIAKQLVQRVISREVWCFEDVADHWDQLVLKSYVMDNGYRRLYQSSTAGHILPVDAIIACVAQQSRKPLDEAIIFSGTVPLIDGVTCYAPRFEAELSDPQTGRTLSARYDVVVNDWIAAS